MMRKSFMRLAISAAVSMVALQAQAATSNGTVGEVWTYGNGSVVVTGFNFTGTGCSNTHGFVIPASNPNLPKLLAVILTARATGAQLQVNAAGSAGCWYPEVLSDASSYVLLLPN